MSSKTNKDHKIVGLLQKSRDELSKTGSSCWISLFPGSRRDGDEWVPDPLAPPKLLIVSKGQKTWLEALDLKQLETLLAENRDDLDAGYAIAGVFLEKELERKKDLLRG